MNTVTSYLDGSAIYGSDKKISSKLRTKIGGRLRQEERSGCIRGFLPSVKNKFAVCDLRNASEPCYLSGNLFFTSILILYIWNLLCLPVFYDYAKFRYRDRLVLGEEHRLLLRGQNLVFYNWIVQSFPWLGTKEKTARVVLIVITSLFLLCVVSSMSTWDFGWSTIRCFEPGFQL